MNTTTIANSKIDKPVHNVRSFPVSVTTAAALLDGAWFYSVHAMAKFGPIVDHKKATVLGGVYVAATLVAIIGTGNAYEGIKKYIRRGKPISYNFDKMNTELEMFLRRSNPQ